MKLATSPSKLALRSGASWGAAFGILGLLAFAAFAGFATALFGSTATVLVAGLAVGLAAMMLPLPWLVAVLFVVSFVVTGQVIYFARFEKALWFPFLIGLVLLVRYPGERLVRSASSQLQTQQGNNLFSFALIVYFSTVLASSAINGVAPLQLVVTAKEYFFLWGLYLVVASGMLAWPLVRKIWLLLPWLMVVQFPLILYQRFIVLPSRAANRMGAEWDAVVGAFGGNPEGGGASGAMGIFCIFGMALVSHAWYSGWMDKKKAITLLSAGFLSIALAEVKFAVVLIPVVFSVVFLHTILRRPFQGLTAVTLAAIVSMGILTAYKAQYSSVQHLGKSETVSEYFDSMFSSSVDDNFANLRTREIGRVAAIRLWGQQHGAENITETLIGHGIGSTRVGSMVVGEAARGWPFNIGRSSLAIVLWEGGLLGTAALLLALTAAAWRAHRIAGEARHDPTDRSLAAASAGICVAVIAGLVYNTDFYYSHQTQLLLMLALGLQARHWPKGKLPAHGTRSSFYGQRA